MLKWIFMLLSVGFSPSLMAQSSREYCFDHLRYWFNATQVEATQICSKDLKADFFPCMEGRAKVTTEDVITAANKCDKNATMTTTPVQDPFYFSARSCPGRLQAGAKMRPRRALEVCQWDSSEVMIKCLVTVTTQAGFHSEHSLQYCRFAKENYAKEIMNFANCTGVEARKGKGTYAVAQACHEQILKKFVREIPASNPPTRVGQNGAPQNVTRARNVPAPVDIRVQESIKPDVVSNRPVSDVPSNVEQLPID